jgi:hypothetical protein
MAVPESDVGSAFLPWSAVGPVVPRRVLGQTVLSIWLRPGTAPDHPGAYGLSDRRIWRAANRSGLLVGTRGTTVTSDEIRAAIGRYSAAAPPVNSVDGAASRP